MRTTISKKNRLKDIAGNIHSNADQITQKIAAKIVEIEKSLVPVDTGALRDSIRVERLDDASY
jgi:hypothetical protein